VVLCSSFANSTPAGAALGQYIRCMAPSKGVRLDAVASSAPLPLAAQGLRTVLFRARSLQGAAQRFKQQVELRASQHAQVGGTPTPAASRCAARGWW
jgi:hypothetical protein